ncbi:alpha/beta hydrolase [Acidipila sp. EB88]|nr:alpha/beta hydrolase [Acidipila sp. EB88]
MERCLVNFTLMRGVALATCLLLPAMSHAQATTPASAGDWAELASFHYGVGANIAYGTFGNTTVHLDVWENHAAKKPVPTLIYIHGGGWVFGDKGGSPNSFLPYIERGWDVVNVEYRMASSASAPGAVQDVRCALRWVYNNADKYHFDTNRIVVSGHSAGGHLALMTGMLTEAAGLDDACPADAVTPPMKVAAIVNWFGISDVNAILAGPDRKTYAVAWLSGAQDKQAVAKQSSPLTYVHAGQPPVITVHGDHDSVVPYSQAQKLKAALDQVGVRNELVTIPGGDHGSFNDAETLRAFREIWKFLDAVVPPPAN